MELNNRIELLLGDVTTLKVDVIVNAANSSLMGGGGVDGAIHRAGGAAILAECREIREKSYPHGLPTGEAVITTAGNLHCSKVIHTVGPVFSTDTKEVRQQLAAAYHNSLIIARDRKVKTIAFPAISTGVYAFPRDIAAGIAYSTVASFLKESQYPKKVIFIFFKQADLDIFTASISAF